MKFKYSITVKRPVNEVFDYLTDFSNYQKIFSANVETKQVSCGPVSVGSKMSCVSKFLGKRMEEHFVVTSYELNKHIEKKSLPGSTIPTSDIISVKPVEMGTEITIIVHAEPAGFFKLATPLIRSKVDKILSKDIINLKSSLESPSFAKLVNVDNEQLGNDQVTREVEKVA